MCVGENESFAMSSSVLETSTFESFLTNYMTLVAPFAVPNVLYRDVPTFFFLYLTSVTAGFFFRSGRRLLRSAAVQSLCLLCGACLLIRAHAHARIGRRNSSPVRRLASYPGLPRLRGRPGYRVRGYPQMCSGAYI